MLKQQGWAVLRALIWRLARTTSDACMVDYQIRMRPTAALQYACTIGIAAMEKTGQDGGLVMLQAVNACGHGAYHAH